MSCPATWNRFGEERKYKQAADTNVNPKHVGETLRSLTREDRLELRRQAKEARERAKTQREAIVEEALDDDDDDDEALPAATGSQAGAAEGAGDLDAPPAKRARREEPPNSEEQEEVKLLELPSCRKSTDTGSGASTSTTVPRTIEDQEIVVVDAEEVGTPLAKDGIEEVQGGAESKENGAVGAVLNRARSSSNGKRSKAAEARALLRASSGKSTGNDAGLTRSTSNLEARASSPDGDAVVLVEPNPR